jgi:SAM-dependent methyltransferase
LVAWKDDKCWKEWQRVQVDKYESTQRKGIGTIVCDLGYSVMADIDLNDKVVLEIGPGDIRHIKYWRCKPREYIISDISSGMMLKAECVLKHENIAFRAILLTRNQLLPLPDASVDVIVSFYSLEHIYPLLPYLKDLKRVLKPGGALAGAIPTEGGLAWGMGRLLTARRWFRTRTINPNKIYCWEHPNFGDHVLVALEKIFARTRVQYWPLPWLQHLDLNLVIRFIFCKER